MLFNFAYNAMLHAIKPRAKGLEPCWKRGDGERENKAATKNLSPADDARRDVWSCGCSVCPLLLPAWQPLPVLQEKAFKMTHRSNAEPIEQHQGSMARIWGEWDKPCDSFGSETILFPKNQGFLH